MSHLERARAHATPDGHVHLRMGATGEYLMAWPDALRFAYLLAAMSAASGYLIQADVDAMDAIANEARAHAAAYAQALVEEAESAL